MQSPQTKTYSEFFATYAPRTFLLLILSSVALWVLALTSFLAIHTSTQSVIPMTISVLCLLLITLLCHTSIKERAREHWQVWRYGQPNLATIIDVRHVREQRPDAGLLLRYRVDVDGVTLIRQQRTWSANPIAVGQQLEARCMRSKKGHILSIAAL